MRTLLTITQTFSACHNTDAFGKGHKCSNLHGHNYTVEMTYAQSRSMPERDVIVPADKVKEAWRRSCGYLDHACLNDLLPRREPTTENLARHIFLTMKDAIDDEEIILVRVTVRETDTISVTVERTMLDH